MDSHKCVYDICMYRRDVFMNSKNEIKCSKKKESRKFKKEGNKYNHMLPNSYTVLIKKSHGLKNSNVFNAE